MKFITIDLNLQGDYFITTKYFKKYKPGKGLKLLWICSVCIGYILLISGLPGLILSILSLENTFTHQILKIFDLLITYLLDMDVILNLCHLC